MHPSLYKSLLSTPCLLLITYAYANILLFFRVNMVTGNAEPNAQPLGKRGINKEPQGIKKELEDMKRGRRPSRKSARLQGAREQTPFEGINTEPEHTEPEQTEPEHTEPKQTEPEH